MRYSIHLVILALLAVALAVPALAAPGNGRLQIIQLDVGQGDGAVIISPLGDVALIDEGPGGTNAMGVSVVGQLQALGITHVEHHFASHYHADHIAEIDAIVAAGIPINRGWDRGGSYTTTTYTTYNTTLGTKRRTMVKNQIVTLDSLSAHPVTIKCINLAGAGLYTGTEENVLSMVLKVSYGEFDAVFGGDLSGYTSGSYKDIETTVGPQVGPVEVYKVHHHGSATSSNPAWLSAIQAKIGVISLGNGNSYGHPTAAALTRLHAANVRTYWTELGTGVAPNPSWDKVSNGQVRISATWQAAGVDTVRGTGFADTFTNSGTAGDVTAPLVTVSSPNGGEAWATGSSHNITWTATDNVGVTSITLQYSTNSGATWSSVAIGEANDGVYAWTVPATATAQALVKVTAYDAAANPGSDMSNAVFTVNLPTFTIVASAATGGTISPAGNVTVNNGTSQFFSIQPSACYGIADVLVDGVSVGAVSSYEFTNVTVGHTIAVGFVMRTFTLATSVTGGGSLTIAPNLSTYNCGTSVEISALAGAGWQFDHWTGSASGSENPHTLVMSADMTAAAVFVDIAAPTAQLTNHNGGEQWVSGESRPITWIATDNAGVTAIDLAYSTDGGTTYPEVIATGLANTGSYLWAIPYVDTQTARVRVTAHDAAGHAAVDDSDANFGIVNPATAVADVLLDPGEVLGLYPNPAFAGAARILYRMPQATSVNVSIYDVTGHMVKKIEAGTFPSGVRTVNWDGRDESGKAASAGIYLVRLATGSGIHQTKRLVLFR
jgi:beta-lactamase superfamily II metal-dependent hydrolase